MPKKNNNKKNKRSFLSTIGLLSSFIGMAGLVLSIISLIPLNGYNIYTTIITTINLLQFEQQRTNQPEWRKITLSQDAQLYIIFLLGSFLSSLFEILLTFIAYYRHQAVGDEQDHLTEEQEVEENSNISSNHSSKQQQQPTQHQHYSKNKAVNRKSWFIRFTCFTLLIQIVFSLFGTHIIYKIKSDVQLIPIEIQHNAFISCAILWINYLSLTLFAFILLFASFCILIGAYQSKEKHQTQGAQQEEEEEAVEEADETSPLIV